jgi:membrane-associated protein
MLAQVLAAVAGWPVVPRVAGRAGIPYAVAGPVLAVFGAAWATTLVLLGDQVGAHVPDVAGVAPIGVLAVLVAALVMRSSRSHRVSKATFRTDSVLKVALLTRSAGAAT